MHSAACNGNVLDMFRGNNVTCNGCLAHRKNWRVITQKMLGSCHEKMVKNMKRRHTIKNRTGGK